MMDITSIRGRARWTKVVVCFATYSKSVRISDLERPSSPSSGRTHTAAA
jgi:hypothetical protein